MSNLTHTESYVSEETDPNTAEMQSNEEWWGNEPHMKTLNQGILEPWDDEGDAIAYKIVSGQIANDANERHDGFYLMVKGYGDASSPDGHGAQLKVENQSGQIRIIVWSDINNEDPTHIIRLDEALESRRNED